MFLILALLTFVGDCQLRLFQLYYLIPGLAISFWYHVYLVQRYGGSPGKLVMGNPIRNLDDRPWTTRPRWIRGSIYILLGTPVSVAAASAPSACRMRNMPCDRADGARSRRSPSSRCPAGTEHVCSWDFSCGPGASFW